MTEGYDSLGVRREHVEIFVKSVPDLLCQDSTNLNSNKIKGSETTLYFYRFNITSCFHRTEECPSCGPHIQGLRTAGIALLRPLTDEQLHCSMKLCMRKSDPLEFRVTPLFAGGNIHAGLVTDVDMGYMQRYHKACLCLESAASNENDLDWDNFTSCDSALLVEKEDVTAVSIKEWARSSNGAYYVLFPIPHRNEDRARPIFSSTAAGNVLNNWWSEHFRRSAQEAHVLVHNLRVQLQVNSRAAVAAVDEDSRAISASQVPATPSTVPILPDSLNGLLVSRGPGVIYHVVAADNPKDIVRVTDAMVLVCADRIRDLLQNKSVPQRLKAGPGVRGLSPLDFRAACDALCSSSLTSDTCGDAQVADGCDGRKVVHIWGHFYAAWTYADHYAAKGVLSSQRVQELLNELGPSPLVHLGASPQTYNPNSHRLVLAYAAPRNLRLTELLSFPDQIEVELKAETLAPASVAPRACEGEVHVQEVHSHASAIYLLPDVCRPLGHAKHFYTGLAVGACVWRLENMLIAHEARAFVLNMAAAHLASATAAVRGLGAPTPDGFLGQRIEVQHVDSEGRWIDCAVVELNRMPTDVKPAIRLLSPSLSTMIEALTPLMACDACNSGRLELLGDSVLKASMGLEVFMKRCYLSEGAMTEGRRKLVSNNYLMDRCLETGLARFMRPITLSGGSSFMQHRPPGMSDNALADGRSLWNASFILDSNDNATNAALLSQPSGTAGGAKKKKKKKNAQNASTVATMASGEASELPLASTAEEGSVHMNPANNDQFVSKATASPLLLQHIAISVPPKYLADQLEALVGAFMSSGGWALGFAVTRAFLDMDRKCSEMFGPSITLGSHETPADCLYAQIDTNLSNNDVSSSTIPQGFVPQQPVMTHLSNHDILAIGHALGYEFRSTALLHEALTHASVPGARSNQRLEFFGDAIIDICAISYLYRAAPLAHEGDISQARSSCLSNQYLSLVALHKLGLHRWLKTGSSELARELNTIQMDEKLLNNIWPTTTPASEPVNVKHKEVSLSSDATSSSQKPSRFHSSKLLWCLWKGATSCLGRKRKIPSSESSPPTLSFIDTVSDASVKHDEIKYESVASAINEPEVVAISEAEAYKTYPEKLHHAGAEKACADALEALFGAIFIDSNGSFDIVLKCMMHIGVLSRGVCATVENRRHLRVAAVRNTLVSTCKKL